MSAALHNSGRLRPWAVVIATLLSVAALSLVLFRPRANVIESGWFQWFHTDWSPAASAKPGKRVAYAPGQLLTVDPTGRFLINSIANKPVFLTGDSPQQLVTQLCADDVNTYLDDRQKKGFNALWVYAADKVYQANPPHNCNGDVPFNGRDFTSFNKAYWNFVDSVVASAERRGIIVFIDPGFVGLVSSGGYLTSYRNASAKTMTEYGQFLGKRYKGYSNIVWSLGGDADPVQSKVYMRLATLATALAASDPNHLITFEACRSGCSSGGNKSSLDALPGPPSWLGINWVYNTHPTVIEGCQAAWNKGHPLMPPIMGEDWYELEHEMTDFQIREEGYWEVLSGCYAGRLFGNAAIYGFNSPNGGVTSPTWRSQLDSVGSVGQANMGKLFRSREHWKLEPDLNHKVVTAGYGSGSTVTTTARTSDGQTIIAYVPDGHDTTLTVDMTKVASKSSLAKAWWFNPSSASTKLIGQFKNSGKQQFTAPDGKDWVLVIDDKAAKLPAPGSKDL